MYNKILFHLRRYVLVVLMLAILALPHQTNAAPDFSTGTSQEPGPGIWTKTTGPSFNLSQFEAPEVSILRYDPRVGSTVYAGTNQGLYRTTNRGENWYIVSNGLTGYGDTVITDFDFDMSNTNVMYMTSWGYGVFKTTDNAATWVRLPDPLGGPAYSTFSETGDSLPPEIIADGPSLNAAREMTSSTMLEEDGSPQTAALPYNISFKQATSVAVNPINPQEVVVTFSSANPGVYRSTDGGASWAVQTGIPGAAYDYVFSPNNPLVRYVSTANGVFRTGDGGSSWYKRGDSQLECYWGTLAVNPTNNNHVLATACGSLFNSTDGGLNWENLSVTDPVLLNQYIRQAAFHPTSNSIVYAVGSIYVNRSSAGGARNTWTATDWGLNTASLATVAVLPNEASFSEQVMVGAENFPRGGVYYRNGTANSFVFRSSGMQFPQVMDFVQDPVYPDMVYAATWGAGIFRSNDNGYNWSPINGGWYLPYTLSITAAANPVAGPGEVILYASTFYSNFGIYRSFDRGQTWELASLDSPSYISFDLCADPDPYYSNPYHLVAATYKGVQFSFDGGSSWIEADGLDETTGAVLNLSSAQHSQRMLAATYGGGIFTSSSGWDWYEANTGILGATSNNQAALTTYAVAISPFQPGVAYAGSSRMFYTENYGESWTLMDGGLPKNDYVRAIDISAKNGSVYAGMGKSGIYVKHNKSSLWQPYNNGFNYIPSIRSLRVIDNLYRDFLLVGTSGQQTYTFEVTNPIPVSPGTIYLPIVTNNSVYFVTDPFEPNNTMVTAKQLPGSGSYNATIPTQSDDDWYRINVTTLGPVVVTLTEVPQGTDYDLQFFDSDGRSLGGSYYGSNNNERYVFLPSRTGLYYMRIYSWSGSSSEPYRFDLSFNRAYATGSISGRLTKSNASAAYLAVRLYYYNGYRWRSYITQTDASGNYSFRGIIPLPEGHFYQVEFGNQEGDNSNLGYFSCWSINFYTLITNLTGYNFDVANVWLSSPPSGANLSMPVTFNWSSRNVAGDNYWITLTNDYNTPYAYWSSPSLGQGTSYQVSSLPTEFSTGSSNTYSWHVNVESPVGYGASYYRNYVNFSSTSGPSLSAAAPIRQPEAETRKGEIPLPPVLDPLAP